MPIIPYNGELLDTNTVDCSVLHVYEDVWRLLSVLAEEIMDDGKTLASVPGRFSSPLALPK